MLRDNLGNLYGTRLFQTSGLEVPAVGAVFVQNAAADGGLRKISITNFEMQLLLQNMGGVLVNGQVPYSVVQQHAAALFTSPAFTGVPTAPTAATNVSTTQVATTEFANPAQSLLPAGGYKWLPGGVLIQWGYVVLQPVGFTPVNYPIPFPNVLLSVQISGVSSGSGSAQSNGASVYNNVGDPPNNPNVTRFNATTAQGNVGGMWLAIGY